MNKRVDFIYGDNNTSVLTLVHPGHFEKTAEYSPELTAFISNLKKKVDATYALVNALSAGEYYGSNRNGDYFPEAALQLYHKTFEALAGIYKHHVNKDPRLSLGKVLFAHYNPTMHRVELIIELDNDRAEKIVNALDKGELPAVSMGCRVPYDVCSICGNRAKTRTLYCDHLKYQMNNVLSDGRKVYAVNTMPKFFDISIVTIPADRTAGFIRRLLSENFTKTSEFIPEHIALDKFLEKTANLEAVADISKELPAKVDAVSDDPKQLILASQKRFSKDQIEKLSEFPFTEILSTMLALRVMPAREDFQKIALQSLGYKKEADELEKAGYIFEVDDSTTPADLDNVSIDRFNEKIAEVFKEDLYEMANTKPLIIGRVLSKYALFNEGQQNAFLNPARVYTGKQVEPNLWQRVVGKEEEPLKSPIKNPGLAMGALGALYIGFAKLQNKTTNLGAFKNFLLKYPWVAPLFLATVGSAAATEFQEAHYRTSPLYADHLVKRGGLDRYIKNTLIAVPPSYYLSYKAEEKAQRGVPLTGVENFVRKHPLLTSYIGGIGATKIIDKKNDLKFLEEGNKAIKELWGRMKKISSVVGRLDNESMDQLYNELITSED
jgi:hypothetical protein